jgi:hypothetical protein
MWCNPANGRVDFEEWSAYEIQLHGIEWIVSLSADWYQSPTKKKSSSLIIWCTSWLFVNVLHFSYFAISLETIFKSFMCDIYANGIVLYEGGQVVYSSEGTHNFLFCTFGDHLSWYSKHCKIKRAFKTFQLKAFRLELTLCFY